MRSNGFAVTGQELQGMVNDKLLLLKPGQTIPNTNRCLTGKEINDRVYVYAGPSGTPAGENYLPLYNYFDPDLNLNVVAPSPNWLPKYEQINAIRATSVLFEMNQEGNPYLNCDLFGFVNGSGLRLDPNNNLDGMFFGGPQYSPQMSPSVKVGTSLYVQANFGLNSAEGSSWGWEAPGIGKLEVYANGTLLSNQILWKYPYNGPNLQSLSYTLTVQTGVSYVIKAYSLVAYTFEGCYDVTNAYYACGGNGDCGCIQC